MEKVKERFEYFYSSREDIFKEINDTAEYLTYSCVEDDNRWGVDLYKRPPPGTVLNEIQLLKDFLNERFEWLKNSYSE